MKKILLFVFTVLFTGIISAQTKVDPELKQRLDHFMKLNIETKFEELMDYIHPSIYEIAPKEMIIEAFKKMISNDEVKISIDSIHIIRISPEFRHDTVVYKQVDYVMHSTIEFKDSSLIADDKRMEVVLERFKERYKGGEIKFDKIKNRLIVRQPTLLIATKDNDNTPWMFMGYQKNETLLKMFYPPEVLDHFKLLEK